MIDSLCADERERSLANPSPELDILLMAVCLEALLGLEIEELQRPALRLESNDRLGQMHDGTIRANRSPNDIVRILKVDDDCLGGGVRFAVDLAHADVLVGLERLELWSAHLLLVSGIECVYIRSSAMISMPAMDLLAWFPLLPCAQ